MSDMCPHCGHPLKEQRDTVTILREWCEANGRHIAPDGSVYESTAAAILDRAPNTLANWRSNGGAGVPYFRHPPNGRVRYRITDLAAYIDASRVTE